MKKIVLAITLLLALPVLANAEEDISSSSKAAPKEHHMQNTNPSPTESKETQQAQEQLEEQAPVHHMQNTNPSPKTAQEKVTEHTMKNN